MSTIPTVSPDEDSWGHSGAFHVVSSGLISGGNFTAIEDSYGSPYASIIPGLIYCIGAMGGGYSDVLNITGSYGLRTSFLMR